MKLFRAPRFSVRSLVVLITLICLYLGVWQLTERHGGDSPAPLIVRRHALRASVTADGLIDEQITCYYVWLFGPTYKLPYERTKTIPTLWRGPSTTRFPLEK